MLSNCCYAFRERKSVLFIEMKTIDATIAKPQRNHSPNDKRT